MISCSISIITPPCCACACVMCVRVDSLARMGVKARGWCQDIFLNSFPTLAFECSSYWIWSLQFQIDREINRLPVSSCLYTSTLMLQMLYELRIQTRVLISCDQYYAHQAISPGPALLLFSFLPQSSFYGYQVLRGERLKKNPNMEWY